MINIVLALGCNAQGDVVELSIGTLPWTGLHFAAIGKIDDEYFEFYNAFMIPGHILKGKNNSLDRYSKYDVVSHNELYKAYYILAKSSLGRDGIVYFITDGFKDPLWITEGELVKRVFNDNLKLSNAKVCVLESTDGVYVSGIGNEISDVDYRTTAEQFKIYLKTRK